MKIAVITPNFIISPEIGIEIRLAQFQSVLKTIAENEVVVWDLGIDNPIDIKTRSKIKKGVFQKKGFRARNLEIFLKDLAALTMHIFPNFSIRSIPFERKKRILDWVDKERPTHAVVVHPDATELIADLHHRGIKIYVDCANVESDLMRQLAKLAPVSSVKLSAILRWRAVERWEKRYFPLADEVWLPSDLDIQRQSKLCTTGIRTRCVPNAIDTDLYHSDSKTQSYDIILPGSFRYEPNIVGARLMSERVLPIVRQAVPEARLLLVGRDPLGQAAALKRDPDIIVTGAVPDTKPYIQQAAVVVAPLLHGGGTRYKILEALALGVPVVTTPLGCEGLEAHDGEHVLIRNIDEFAEAIVSILRNKAIGQRLAKQGRTLVEEKYSWRTVEQIVRASLNAA